MRLSFYLFFVLSMAGLSAQQVTQCSRNLALAEEAFEQGRLLYLIDQNQNGLFFDCLQEGGFSKEERIRAYKLLAKAHLFSDNESEAEAAIVSLLYADKEHQLTKDDPAELYFLYSKFITEPIFRLALRAGINKSMPRVIDTHPPGAEKHYNQDGNNTGVGIGFWGELLAERHIANGFEVGLGVNIWNLSYEVEATQAEGALLYTVKNESTWLRVPLLGRYNFNYNKKNTLGQRHKVLPYVFAGVSYDFVLDAKYKEAERQGGQAFTLPESEADLKEKDQVSTHNVSLFFGLGAKLRVGKSKVDFLTLEVKYDNQLLNYINTENRYANEVMWQNIGHVEDDLTLNAVSFSFGYTRSFYNPRKSKQYRK